MTQQAREMQELLSQQNENLQPSNVFPIHLDKEDSTDRYFISILEDYSILIT
jgi:hypothetical protein